LVGSNLGGLKHRTENIAVGKSTQKYNRVKPKGCQGGDEQKKEFAPVIRGSATAHTSNEYKKARKDEKPLAGGEKRNGEKEGRERGKTGAFGRERTIGEPQIGGGNDQPRHQTGRKRTTTNTLARGVSLSH